MLSQYRLKIVDYHDCLINEIDIKVETLLTNKVYEEDQRHSLNKKREEFIKRIKEVEASNLDNFNTNLVNDLGSLEGLSENDLDKRLFKRFCFIVQESSLENNYPTLIDAIFGYLIIVDEFLSKETLILYKQFVMFNNQKSILSFKNKFFFLKYGEVR